MHTRHFAGGKSEANWYRSSEGISWKQATKVIWHQAASPPHMAGSIVFASWRQCAPHVIHVMLPWPTRLHIPNDTSIGSAAFAQLRAKSSYILQWAAPSPSKLPLPMGLDPGPHLIHGFLGQPDSSTKTASRSVQPFSQDSLLSEGDRQTDRPRYSVGNNKPHLRT